VNNEQASFAANRDLIANLTGITLNAAELRAGTIAVAKYFVWRPVCSSIASSSC